MSLQDDLLIENILNRTFFRAWKNGEHLKDSYKYGNYSDLELQIDASCDLQCKYCYYAKYSKDLYPAEISKPAIILDNLETVLKWLSKNAFYPMIDLFSGELFAKELGFRVLDRMIDWHIENQIKGGVIVVPSNFTFIFGGDKTYRVTRLLDKARKYDVALHLSASVDGKYCDANRPIRSGLIRTDDYYAEVFKFCKTHNFSFHPMVYSEEIDKWIDNFLWFQENFDKHGIDWKSLYLLEVRNAEWSKQQLRDFYRFIRFVVNWTYKKAGVNKEEFPKFTFKHKLFNLFSMFSTIGRGIGCSIQSSIQLRLGDLTATLCHRSAYKELNLFKLKVKNDEIVGIESINPGLLISMFSAKTSNFPFCETCSIKELCSGQCLGAMYETNRDNFIPIPTVCALEHAKVAAVLDELKQLDLLESFYAFSVGKRESLKLYDKEWGNKYES